MAIKQIQYFMKIQCTEASCHIYTSQWPVLNVKARFYAENLGQNVDSCCFILVAFPVVAIDMIMVNGYE